MQKIKPVLLISLLLACACPVRSSQIIEQHSYLHRFGAKTTLMQWQRLAGNPQQIRAEHGGEDGHEDGCRGADELIHQIVHEL